MQFDFVASMYMQVFHNWRHKKMRIKSEVFRKYGMLGTVALLATVGSAEAASMGAYSEALASGNTKASAIEAMRLIEGKANSDSVMKTAEQLMTSAVATGDERVVKWVAAGILKGAEESFNSAELGVRVVWKAHATKKTFRRL